MLAFVQAAAALLLTRGLPLPELVQFLHGRLEARNRAALECDVEGLATLAERVEHIGFGPALVHLRYRPERSPHDSFLFGGGPRVLWAGGFLNGS